MLCCQGWYVTPFWETHDTLLKQLGGHIVAFPGDLGGGGGGGQLSLE